MLRYRHTAVDDVTHEPVSQLDARACFGQICLTITPVDPDQDRVHHWLTPVAARELVRSLTSDPDVRDAVLDRPIIPMRKVP